MLKKTIKYTNYNGEEKEKDFYFHLNKAEISEMQLSEQGGLDKFIERIVNANSTPELVKLFKEIILKSYGVKSLDGEQFIKSEELRTAFSQTEAYSNLFMELATDSDKAAEFMNGIMPADMRQNTENAIAQFKNN